MTHSRSAPTFAMRAFSGAHVAVAAGLIALLLSNVVPNFDAMVRDDAVLLALMCVYIVYAIGVSIALAVGRRAPRPWLALAAPGVVLVLAMGDVLIRNEVDSDD